MDNKLIRQHNAITKARYEMSALEKNILYMLLAQLKESDLPKKIYKVQIKELQEITGRDVDHTQFAKTTKKLVGRLLHTRNDEKELSFNLLSSGEYKRHSGAIELELSQEIRVFLFALKKNFTQFKLSVALGLKSKYSKRIYEMLCQFKDTGILRISIAEFKGRLLLSDPKTGKDKYPKYGLLRVKVLDVAQKELNEKADVSFTYEASKTGKKYTHLVFFINNKEKLTSKGVQTFLLDAKDMGEQNERLLKRMVDDHCLSPWQALKVLHNVPAKEIGKILYDIKIAKINNKVERIGPYTATVFNRQYQLGI